MAEDLDALGTLVMDELGFFEVGEELAYVGHAGDEGAVLCTSIRL